MRIISGALKGKKLIERPNLKHLRPTSDKNRETLFNLLTLARFIKDIGFELTNANVLDVCCGTGSVAFEAISRGAEKALLIDNNSLSIGLAKENAQHLGLEGKVEFLLTDVKKHLPKNYSCQDGFDLVYIDPPYKEDYLQIINNLLAGGFIGIKSLLVIEVANNMFEQAVLDISQTSSFQLLEARKSSKLTSFGFFRFTEVVL